MYSKLREYSGNRISVRKNIQIAWTLDTTERKVKKYWKLRNFEEVYHKTFVIWELKTRHRNLILNGKFPVFCTGLKEEILHYNFCARKRCAKPAVFTLGTEKALWKENAVCFHHKDGFLKCLYWKCWLLSI